MAIQATTQTSGATLDDATVEAFIASIHGPVIQPGDAGYDDARAVQNGLIDRRPAFIVRCSGPADVIQAVNFARDNGLVLSVRGGGHNVAGNSVNDDGVVIDLSEMRSVRVDPVARTARAEGGATWAELDRETQVFGLATPGGQISTTGIAGLTLHGGYGHLRRKYGLSLDNLISVDIVTADGKLRTASETENADLFWAVRGAGSNFGVITSFEFRLHPVGPKVMLCAVGYHQDDAPHVMAQWRDFMATAPEEITSTVIFWSVPSDPPAFPAELHGVPIAVVLALYAGPADEGARAVQPLRELATPVLDLSGPDMFARIQGAFDPFFPKGLNYYWKSILIDGMSDDVITTLCRMAAERPSPRTMIDVWHNGGAMQRVDATDTAFGDRGAPFMIGIESTWSDDAESEANISWTREVWSELHRYSSSGAVYLNFPGFGEEKENLVRAAYGANYDRLAALKAKYDPDNLFHMNQNIKPHAGDTA
ncbi:MAG TPA: FAD-binding oxidoreductase [Thermomicrobiales bacterium]|nr:FAD-binding oxidoreductase [Thermomicrobiales bacterium]